MEDGPKPDNGKRKGNKWKRPEMEGKWPKKRQKKTELWVILLLFVISSKVEQLSIVRPYFPLFGFWLIRFSTRQPKVTPQMLLYLWGGGVLRNSFHVQSAPKERRRRRAEKRSSKRVFLESPFLLCPLKVSS